MFGLGGVAKELSEDVFQQWIEFLLDSPDDYAVSIALDLYDFYYLRDERPTLPLDLTFKLLAHPALFRKREHARREQMDDHHWAEIGKTFVGRYPLKGLELAKVMLEHFGEDGTILDSFHSSALGVLSEALRQQPKEVWLLAQSYLGPPIDSRAFHIKEWLRGGEFHEEGAHGAISLIPADEIWRWVDADLEKHVWYVAGFVPPLLFREPGKICLAREVLGRYGEREDVRRALMANFSTEGWSGPESLHYERKKLGLLEFQRDEENSMVRQWLDEYVSVLNREIERARIREERENW
jgi:hypothetical protein